MNIKIYSLKAICAALACTTVLSSMLAAYATDVIINETPMDDSAEINSINALADDSAGTGSSDSGWTTEENSFEDIKVTYQQSSSYAVTIPKTIALDSKKQAAYSVKVSGEIDANQRVYVAPVDGITDSTNLDFYMSDLSGKKANVVATVTQNKTYWNSEDVTAAYEETNNSVSAPDLTAGIWEGTFQVEIRLETNTAQDEEEADPYETAPENEYSDWLYELDEENGTIGLKKYKGTSKNVNVYDNYQIGDKTYKTKILDATKIGYPSSNYMFASNKSVETIAFGDNIDFSEVADMEYMFSSCETLTSIDFGNGFDTSNVTKMEGMFSQSKSLTDLDLSSFNTSNVTNMKNMFLNCTSLTSLDLSSFNTSNVTDMCQMFSYCKSLSGLDLSSFNTSNVTDMRYMFSACPKLKVIYATEGKWLISQASTSMMFDSCGISSVTYK